MFQEILWKIKEIYYSFQRLYIIVKPARIRWKKLHEDAKIPTRAYIHDGAYDVYSVEDIHLIPGDHKNVGCGVAIEVRDGFSYDLRGRSGLNRLGIIASLGLVDSFYSNEIRVVLSNFSGKEYTIKKGDRVAQIKFNPVFNFPWQEVKEFKHRQGTRGMNGWGSSGK